MRKLQEENDEKVVIRGKLVKVSELSLASIPRSLKKRCHSRIVYDALVFIRDSGMPTKTGLMYGVGLSFTQLQDMIKQLREQSLVRAIEKDRKTNLVITEKGLQVLNLGRKFLTSIGELDAKKHEES